MRASARCFLASLLALALPAASSAQGFEFPGFAMREIATNGATIHVRSGGTGPAVVLLHGYGETGDMWAPLAADLARDHTVIVPDLRGLGLSSKPRRRLRQEDPGRRRRGRPGRARTCSGRTSSPTTSATWSAFQFAARYPERVRRLVLIDAPVPGVGPWEEILKNPLLWHFRFGGPDMERLVAGRERIYLDRFWNEFSATPARFSEAARHHYAKLYALPGAMHSGFAQFAAFDQDAIDNRALLAQGQADACRCSRVGGEKSFGPMMATVMRSGGDDVTEGIVPDSGHWIMEESPGATVELVRDFLARGNLIRLRPARTRARR